MSTTPSGSQKYKHDAPASAERLAILLVWRNYMKGRREKVRGSPTPAMEREMMDIMRQHGLQEHAIPKEAESE